MYKIRLQPKAERLDFLINYYEHDPNCFTVKIIKFHAYSLDELWVDKKLHVLMRNLEERWKKTIIFAFNNLQLLNIFLVPSRQMLEIRT